MCYLCSFLLRFYSKRCVFPAFPAFSPVFPIRIAWGFNTQRGGGLGGGGDPPNPGLGNPSPRAERGLSDRGSNLCYAVLIRNNDTWISMISCIRMEENHFMLNEMAKHYQ